MNEIEERLSLYTIDTKYCDFLRETDRCIVYNSGSKATRPFVGIVLEIIKDDSSKFNYFAPLSSPKPKHLTMREGIDLVKINRGRQGVINLNNMFPVPKECLHLIDTALRSGDSLENQQYKMLLSDQLDWCNISSNAQKIRKKAEMLYRKVAAGDINAGLLARCCKFSEDENACVRYCELHGYSLT